MSRDVPGCLVWLALTALLVAGCAAAKEAMTGRAVIETACDLCDAARGPCAREDEEGSP